MMVSDDEALLEQTKRPHYCTYFITTSNRFNYCKYCIVLDCVQNKQNRKHF